MQAAHPERIHKTLGDGRWFPGHSNALRREVASFIDAAEGVTTTGRVVAAIAPHAGYLYSGPVAGYTFRAIRNAARAGHAPDLAVVLGGAHRAVPPGVALLDANRIRSPLGDAVLDTDAATHMVKGRNCIRLDSRPHMGEHSAENEVPFLQVALPDTPLVVGIVAGHDATTLHQLDDALTALARDRRVLVVASTDLLHDADYDKVTAIDQQTLAHIVALDSNALAASWSYESQVCCGIAPVLAAMGFARTQGCDSGTRLHYRNSGDDHPESRGNWVVGYGAVIFSTD